MQIPDLDALSLIQTVGRAARNASGHVIMYADYVSKAMKVCIDETSRRRAAQQAYNEANGITPKTIVKPVRDIVEATKEYHGDIDVKNPKSMTTGELRETIKQLEKSMKDAAKNLDFERAAELRDILFELKASTRA